MLWKVNPVLFKYICTNIGVQSWRSHREHFSPKCYRASCHRAFLRSSSFPCHDPTTAQWGMKSQEMGASFKKAPSSLMRHWEETAMESDKIPLWNLWRLQVHFPLESDESEEIYKIRKNTTVEKSWPNVATTWRQSFEVYLVGYN